jgi:uncharacterized protein (TIGR03437 family)
MTRAQIKPTLLALMTGLIATNAVQGQAVSPLTATPATVTLTYQKPSTAGAAVVVKVTAASSTYFTVDPASVPVWLTLSATSGTVTSTGVNISFTPNSLVGSFGAGSFGGTVKLRVAAFADLSVPVTLVVSNPAPTVTVTETNTQTINWTQGSAYPTRTLTLVSSNDPINFTVAPSVTAPSSPAAWLKVNKTSGIAYSWGTPIAVTFTQAVFDLAAVGDTLTGTVAITPAGGSAINVSFTINVQPPAAVITRIYPNETPVQPGALSTDAPLTVIVTGSGFVAAPSSQKTVVTVGSATLDTANVTVVSSTTLVLSIPPDNLAATGNVSIGTQNPSVGSPNTTPLNVTDAPIVYAITDAASLVQAAPGSSPTVSPYEIISLFGANFGPGASEIVSGSLDSFSRYPNSLTAQSHTLTVTFYRADGTTLVANAYLLFATATQINALVPSGVAGQATVKVVVTYNSKTSTAYPATVTVANPGIFTVSSSGTGQGAILHATDYSVNAPTNKAAKGSTVLIYLSGLGAPNSTAANTASTSGAVFPTACISAANYLSTVNTATTHPSPAWTTLDGAVILSSKIAAGHFAPCIGAPAPATVTIGGAAATVAYAGWTGDSLAGLYQINVVVPTTATSGNAIPVVVTVGGQKSQNGVTMAIQ